MIPNLTSVFFEMGGIETTNQRGYEARLQICPPNTSLETIRHRWYLSIFQYCFPGFWGFGGLIQGQIYNPVNGLSPSNKRSHTFCLKCSFDSMSFWISPGAICDRSLEDNHHGPSMIPCGGLIAWGFYLALVRVPLDSHEDGEIIFVGKLWRN